MIPALLLSVVAPIIGGTAAPDDDAVVLLVSYPQDRSTWYSCTATVVSPTVLLTAAHCVDAANHPGFLFGAYLGEDASGFGSIQELEPELIPIGEVHAHPDYNPLAPFHADIGVAILDEAVTITPIPYNREPLTVALAGEPARMVGYGQSQVGVFSATRRQAETVVAGLDPDDTVRVGDLDHLTCLGDSGGPALVDFGDGEVVIGADSYADNGNCDLPAHFRRTDLYLDFIDTYTGYEEPPSPDAGPGEPGDDAGVPGGDDESAAGCCSTGGDGDAPGAIFLALALGLAARRRAVDRL